MDSMKTQNISMETDYHRYRFTLYMFLF